MTDAPLLEVEDLHVRLPIEFGEVHAVRGLCFSIAPGETFAIVGESGCGKSMTSLAIMDLLPRSARRQASRLTLGNTPLDKASKRAMSDIRGSRMAMIFQEPMTALNPVFTIGDQLQEAYLRHRGGSAAEARKRAVYLLDRVGIPAAEQRIRQFPHQLSGGLRQRVMIAMALMCGPELIIADEPTTALDVTIQAQILLLLRELQQEFRLSLLFITHDLGIVARIADRVAVMYAGEFVETGTAEELFRMPVHPYTRGLLAAIPVPGKTTRGAPLAAIPGTVPSLAGEIAGCAFRNRCPYAIEACANPVALAETAPGRAWRCILPEAAAAGLPAPVAAGQLQ